MTVDQAHEIITGLTRRLKGVPQSDVLQDYYVRFERLNHEHGKRVADHLLDHRTFWPSLAELRESIEATTKAEYAAGQRVTHRPPWHTTPEALEALRAQERVIAMSDEEYERALDDYRRRREAGVPLRALPGGRS